MKKLIRITALILLGLVLLTYYKPTKYKSENLPFYEYTDILTGQEWRVVKVDNEINEFPINIFDRLSGSRYGEYIELRNELDTLEKVKEDNEEIHRNYNDSRYTGGLTLDDLGYNGGSTLNDWELTSLLHKEAQKRLKKQHDLYLDASNKAYDLKGEMKMWEGLLTTEAWELRNTVSIMRIVSIVALLLVIFYSKIFKLSKKVFSFIIND
ncbi:hypothetical protein KHA94_13395 [Bacillus sp. FJAT-49705]|uniref:Uncharacterized protein n=1 Tax=Cytobacillus citreus TaxID=2833586 RepID=A0ABS5NVM5_9BACI|nr:hypothetical protein [Cytobacillus citreus]MBS4191178.1 hypothetical protein [Cytobacillus citreus]